MALFCILTIIFLLSPETVSSVHPLFGTCPPQSCGTVSNVTFPFWIQGKHPPHCGYPGFMLTCEEDEPILRISDSDLIIRNVSYENQSFTVANDEWISDRNCPFPIHSPSFNSPSIVTPASNLELLFFFNCSAQVPQLHQYDPIPCLSNRTHRSFAVLNSSGSISMNTYSILSKMCTSLSVPVMMDSKPRDSYAMLLERGFLLLWAAPSCRMCLNSGGQCGYVENQFKCLCPDRPHLLKCDGKNNQKKKYIAGFVGVGGGAALVCIAFIIWCFRKKLHISASSKPLTRAISYDPSLNSDIENSGFLHGTQFFDYKELKEATNNFDSSKELGDGGFGIVYHGQLSDGRNVAVKRLYEYNFRRVEQFKNEIKILSQLRHPNLVVLYGCSTRHSRELLLVYEFIPNGTLGDHLHGDRAKPGALGWLTRMRIAIETANALKYLHAADIIHRDIKTNNILLDNNFRVKVADFGLSRLFPTNATHVSTVPQGTPGYVDPDYHRCYQLTEKSDVYSFGVVLIELISSQPAVDTDRHRDEINLANLAIKKIHNSALKELVDPNIGFDSHPRINKMITCVSELAFRCLQDEKDIRPSMEEVLETLKGIGEEGEEYHVDKVEEENTLRDDVVLQRKMPPSSPAAVTDAWESTRTTPNTST